MTFLLPLALAFAAALATELALAFAVAGRGRRKAAVLACLWANLLLEPVRALTIGVSELWLLLGLVILVVGEAAAYRELARLRADQAFGLAVIGNAASALVMAGLV